MKRKDEFKEGRSGLYVCVCVCVCVCALEVEVGGNNELGDPEEEWGGHNGREGR